MKINKEQEVVMEIHKKNDSKIHKKSDGKVKSKMTSARTKGRTIAGEAGSVIAAGSAAGPYGMAIGAAAGKAAEMQIDTAVYKTEKKMRMLKYFKDNLQTPENQNDNIIRVAVDLVKMKASLMIRRADEHKDADEGRVIYVDYEGVSETPSNYYDIMCVYMVRYGYKNTAMDMNVSNKGKLQQVVNDMCHFTTEVVTETKGKGKNKKTTKILEVRVTLKTYNDMISEYQFSEDQIKMLQTLMSACNGRSSPSGEGSSPSNLKSSLSAKEIKKYMDKISNAKQKKAVEFALSKVGYEYSQARRFSGTAFDCSSLVYCAWKAAGI